MQLANNNTVTKATAEVDDFELVSSETLVEKAPATPATATAETASTISIERFEKEGTPDTIVDGAMNLRISSLELEDEDHRMPPHFRGHPDSRHHHFEHYGRHGHHGPPGFDGHGRVPPPPGLDSDRRMPPPGHGHFGGPRHHQEPPAFESHRHMPPGPGHFGGHGHHRGPPGFAPDFNDTDMDTSSRHPGMSRHGPPTFGPDEPHGRNHKHDMFGKHPKEFGPGPGPHHHGHHKNRHNRSFSPPGWEHFKADSGPQGHPEFKKGFGPVGHRHHGHGGPDGPRGPAPSFHKFDKQDYVPSDSASDSDSDTHHEDDKFAGPPHHQQGFPHRGGHFGGRGRGRPPHHMGMGHRHRGPPPFDMDFHYQQRSFTEPGPAVRAASVPVGAV